MLNWILQNISTIIIGLIILTAFVAAIIYLIGRKKRGISNCDYSCTDCPTRKYCSKHKK